MQRLQTQKPEAGWVPKTKVGIMVQAGQIVSLEDIFTQGLKIKEPELIDVLLPGLKQEVLGIGFVQKQTDAGEKSRFKAIVAVGNGSGFLGVGGGKARQVRSAIDKGTLNAKLNVVPIRRGCGSWECGCGQPHSIPFKIRGKCGSVGIEIIPGPRGLGLVGGEIAPESAGFRALLNFVPLDRDETGMIVAECPSIPGCISQGKTEEEALANIREAIQACIEARAAHGMRLTVATCEVEVAL